MKVLLVNPCSESEDVNQLCEKGPPLGLASIAAVLETHGVDVRIADLAVSGQKSEDKNALPLSGVDVVGVSSTMTERYPQAIAVSRAVKKHDKDMPVILGGNHATFMHTQILLQYSSVDFVVLHEGEHTMPGLLEALDGRKDFAEVKGIAYREKKGKVIRNPAASRIKDLDILPMPARHLLPMELYGKGSGIVVSSRGCPYRCVFCSTSAFFGHEVRMNSVDRILREIDCLAEKHHVRDISFNDDLFTFSRTRVESLCEKIIERNLDIKWGCLSRVDYVDAALVRKMHKAGCQHMFFGVESGCQSVLRLARKGQTVERARRAIEQTKKAGIAVCASFILGLPGETPETIKKTLDFILKTKPSTIRVSLLVPYPGTSIWERPEEFGIRILGQEWQYYGHAIPMTETETLSWRDLLRARSLIIQEYIKARGEGLEPLHMD